MPNYNANVSSAEPDIDILHGSSFWAHYGNNFLNPKASHFWSLIFPLVQIFLFSDSVYNTEIHKYTMSFFLLVASFR